MNFLKRLGRFKQNTHKQSNKQNILTQKSSLILDWDLQVAIFHNLNTDCKQSEHNYLSHVKHMSV